MSWIAVSNAMILLIMANLMPWALGLMCGARWAAPMDCGIVWRDGRRLLGSHKTWRGLAASLLGCGGAAVLLGMHWWFGVQFAALSMLGDAISSALKRRRGREPGQDDFGLDQLPEALLPLTVSSHSLNLGWREVILVTTVFAVLDLISLRIRNPRRRPVEADGGT